MHQACLTFSRALRTLAPLSPDFRCLNRFVTRVHAWAAHTTAVHTHRGVRGEARLVLVGDGAGGGETQHEADDDRELLPGPQRQPVVHLAVLVPRHVVGARPVGAHRRLHQDRLHRERREDVTFLGSHITSPRDVTSRTG